MINAEHIDESIRKSTQDVTSLDNGILVVGGYSTPTMRRLFNNLCNTSGTYLEVGLWMGGTFVSSFNKDMVSIGIEDYSQDFGVVGVKEHLERNVVAFSERAKEIYIHNEDCFKIDLKLLPDNIDIFFYDGNHGEESQAKALPYFINKMADKFIYIVDDFNWEQVSKGTNIGLRSLVNEVNIERTWALRGYALTEDEVWHNGVAIYLINKIPLNKKTIWSG